MSPGPFRVVGRASGGLRVSFAPPCRARDWRTEFRLRGRNSGLGPDPSSVPRRSMRSESQARYTSTISYYSVIWIACLNGRRARGRRRSRTWARARSVLVTGCRPGCRPGAEGRTCRGGYEKGGIMFYETWSNSSKTCWRTDLARYSSFSDRRLGLQRR